MFRFSHLSVVIRESLFLLTYLMFVVNVVVGLIVVIWRMVITALYNIIHLVRMDISLLHRTAESFDPGDFSVWSNDKLRLYLCICCVCF